MYVCRLLWPCDKPYSSQAQDRFVISTLQLSGSLCLWGASLVVNLLVGSLPGRKSGLLVVNLLVGSPQPSARQAWSVYPRSASLCLSGPLWAFLGLSKPASPPASQLANSASQPASQLPGRNSSCGYIGALVVILLVGMLQEWSRNVLFCIVLYCYVCTVLVLEWSCSGPGMVRECSWNRPGMVLE